MAVTQAKTVDTTNIPLSDRPGLADVDNLTPGTDVAASGAIVEPEIVSRIDTNHPAVDDEPRKGQPKVANQIDFNDPTVPGYVQVARNLGLADDYDAPTKAVKA